MKTISRLMTTALGTAICLTLFVSKASAGCGDTSNLVGPFEFVQQPLEPERAAAQAEEAHQRGGNSPSIVGLWKVQFVSKGNTAHNPPIPDGAIVDFGYSEWHSDGTEIMNSGGHAANTGNFCMGVWGMTGFNAYELNHFAISYDGTSGALTANVNIRETLTLSPSGDSYSGTFTIDVYDPKGDHVDHVAGTITGTRLTVDSTLP